MAGKIENSAGNSDYATAPVPFNERMPKSALTMAWWGVCSAMFYIVVAATLAIQFGTRNAIIGMVLSVIAYGLINGVISRDAIRTGLSVALFSRVLFGNFGAALATLIFFATAVYFSVFEGSVIAMALHDYFPGVGIKMAYLIVVVYSVILIFGSIQTWLDKLNGVLLPFYIIGLIAAVSLTISEYGYSNAWLNIGPQSGEVSHGWWNCFTYFMGVWILMMYTFDYARFGRQEDADYHAKFNFGMPFYLFTFVINGVIGIFLATTIKTEGGLSEVSIVLGLLKLMGIWGLVFVWVTQTRINTANFYLAAANMHTFFEKIFGMQLPKWVWAIVVGALVYVMMLANVFSYILQALAYQGVFVVAWVGVALTHILTSTYDKMFSGQIEYHHERVPAFNPCGLTAWFLGTAVGLVLMHADGALATFSAPATFVVSIATYALMLTRAKKQWFVIQGY